MLKVCRYTVNEIGEGLYELIEGNDRILVNLEEKEIMKCTINNRNYKAKRYTKSYEWLIDELLNTLSVKEEATEEVAEEENCDLQDVVININQSQIGRVVGMNNGKYRIVMSTGKLVELNRNEFYLDGEEPINQEETKTVKVGHYNYEIFENEYVIRFTSKSLDRVFVYNKKFKDFKLMQLSTNRVLLAKRYYNNYYNIISQLQEYIKRGA